LFPRLLVTLQCSCAHEFLCRSFLERPAPRSPRKIRAQKFFACASCAARRTEQSRGAPSPRAAWAERSPILYSRPRCKWRRQILCWPLFFQGQSFFRHNAPPGPGLHGCPRQLRPVRWSLSSSLTVQVEEVKDAMLPTINAAPTGEEEMHC